MLENDPDLKTYREMGNLFSDSDFLIVTMRPNESIFTNKSLQRIEKIENAILEIDGVSQVLSILESIKLDLLHLFQESHSQSFQFFGVICL